MHTKKGFTLIEILVVIALIGVLSTLGIIAYTHARAQAKVTKAFHEINAIVTAIKLLENDTGEWPGHQEVDDVTTSGSNEIWDLGTTSAGLVQTDGAFQRWNGPYMQTMLPDPWGNDYFYDSDYQVNGENRVVVGSFGPNGTGPNLYDADDIIKVLR
jgi:prepilin-type N-terminal cleavage/methylation domain-containing protein